MRSRILPPLLCAILAATGSAEASGLYMADNGPKAVGRGGAFVANPTDLYAFYYNPGALTSLPGWNIQAGLGAMNSSPGFTPESGGAGVDNEGPLFTPIPALFASKQFGFRRLTLVGGFITPPSPYEFQYDPSGPSRFMVTETKRVQFTTGAGAALEVLPGLSLGGVFLLEHLDIMLRRNIVVSIDGEGGPGREGVVEINAAQYAKPTFVAGAKYRLGGLHLGASYWRGADFRADGDVAVDLDVRVADAFGSLGQSLSEEDANQMIAVDAKVPAAAVINLPDFIKGGVGYEWGRFYAEFAVSLYRWSRIKSLLVDIDDEKKSLAIAPPISVLGFKMTEAVFPDTDIPQKMEDTLDYRFGVEYAWRPTLAVRAGALVQPSAVPPETLMLYNYDADTYGMSGGFSKTWGGFTLDASGMYLLRGEQKTSESEIVAINGLSGLDDTTRKALEAVATGLSGTQTKVRELPTGNGTHDGTGFVLFLGAGFRF
ncbi:MAG: outer membrane protein transport protein [Nitrospirae bacterium]|nr:outer membrane protein transport protein [Nitrospirota bacterium]